MAESIIVNQGSSNGVTMDIVGQPGGVVGLDSDGLVFSNQIPTMGGSTINVNVTKSTDYINRITAEPLSVARQNLAAATDGNGNVLFGGGYTGSSTSSDVVDKYTPSGTRTTLTVLSVARFNLAAATDGNGNVLFGGGIKGGSQIDAVDKYTPSGTRTTLTPLSVARQNLAAATDGAGNVLFGGGYSGFGMYLTDFDVVDKYTPSGIRTTLTPLSVVRHNLAAATDGAGNVLFGGGGKYDGSGASDVVDKYFPDSTTIKVPIYSRYKFEEHATEQVALTTEDIKVKAPNTGYIKYITEDTITV